MATSKEIYKKAMTLKPAERAVLINGLLSSLDIPDESIDKLWASEVESRIDAYEAGKLAGKPIAEVLSKLK